MRVAVADSIVVSGISSKSLGYSNDSSTCSRLFGLSAMTALSALFADDRLHTDNSCDNAYAKWWDTKTELYDRELARKGTLSRTIYVTKKTPN
jgi:hypothetical protein